MKTALTINEPAQSRNADVAVVLAKPKNEGGHPMTLPQEHEIAPDTTVVQSIRAQLFSLQDSDYKEFNRKLIPTIDPDRIIGVRIPEIRTLAKRLQNTPEAEKFLRRSPIDTSTKTTCTDFS